MNDDRDPYEFDEDESEEKGFVRRNLPAFGAGGLLLVFAGGIYGLINALGEGGPPAPPQVQEISLVVPPPPPPPPPEMEPPPEPEVEEVDVPEPDPEPAPEEMAESDEPPPGEDLGLDAEGVAGSDGFGLKAKKGGRGLLGGGSRFGWYASVVQRDIQDLLSKDESVKTGAYSVVVRIWVSPDGVIEDSEIVSGTGDATLDSALRTALSRARSLSELPPEDLPQPIKLRITSRT